MDWQNAKKEESGGIIIPDRWLNLYYYEALNILFRFENSLRVFVYVVLKRELGKDWDAAAIESDTTIRTETRKRIAQAREHGYLGYEVTSPVLYLNSGELAKILTSEAYWKHFASYFKGSKAIVLTKLQEIGTVRNSLAHFRPIKQDDVELIKQNSKHVLLGIESCLLQLFSINDVVPTNTTEPWYKEIESIGNKLLTTSLFYCKNQEWVRLKLDYETQTLQKDMYAERFCMFKVTTIKIAQILKKYPVIKDNCIYVSEYPMYGSFDKTQKISIPKSISIVFSYSKISTSYKEIAECLKDIALNVESETDLVLQDNLARGNLIESRSGTARIQKNEDDVEYWSFDLDNLQTDVTEIDDVEYWGQRSNYVSDFIAGTSRYPWMPSPVSTPAWFD